jgi:hypothetical protein
LSYLKTFPKGRVVIDTSYPDHSRYPVEDHSKWIDFYPDDGEEIPKDLPPKKGPRVRMTIYVDADHAHDLVTRRSITGNLVILNNTIPINLCRYFLVLHTLMLRIASTFHQYNGVYCCSFLL